MSLFVNKLPDIQENREMSLEVVKEIEARIANGFRLKADFKLLLDYAKEKLNAA